MVKSSSVLSRLSGVIANSCFLKDRTILSPTSNFLLAFMTPYSSAYLATLDRVSGVYNVLPDRFLFFEGVEGVFFGGVA